MMKNLKAENPCNMGISTKGGGGKASRATELALASGESSARQAKPRFRLQARAVAFFASRSIGVAHLLWRKYCYLSQLSA